MGAFLRLTQVTRNLEGNHKPINAVYDIYVTPCHFEWTYDMMSYMIKA